MQSVEQKQKTEKPPKLYDLTTLQRESNKIYGYTAQQTLEYLQSLYEKKLATYPRTDSNYITEDMKEGISELIDIITQKIDFEVTTQNIENKTPLQLLQQFYEIQNNCAMTEEQTLFSARIMEKIWEVEL